MGVHQSEFMKKRQISLTEKSLGCVKSEKNNLLDASSSFGKQQRTQNANQAAGNQGERRPALQGKKTKRVCSC